MARRLTAAELSKRGKRRCSRCKAIRPLTQFYRDARGRDGYGYRCKPCVKTAVNESATRDPEGKRTRDKQYRDRPEIRRKQRDRRLRSAFGIGSVEYDALLAEQGGVCAVCKGTGGDVRGREMPVDHDHQSGAVRGILCDICNRFLGLFGDDPVVLRSAVRYLRKWQVRSE